MSIYKRLELILTDPHDLQCPIQLSLAPLDLFDPLHQLQIDLHLPWRQERDVPPLLRIAEAVSPMKNVSWTLQEAQG